MADKEEVQLVDMVLRIRNKLTEAADLNLPLPELAIDQLNSHLEKLINRLPQVLIGIREDHFEMNFLVKFYKLSKSLVKIGT